MTAETRSVPRSFPWDLIADLTLLLLVFAATAWLNLRWADVNQAPPRSDDSSHLAATIELTRTVLDPTIPAHGPAAFVVVVGHYPPLVYQVTFAFFQWMGVSNQAAVASLMPFLLIMMLSMYGIGRHMGGRALGLACGVLGGTSPAVLELSRTYFLDMPAAALVAASLCSLLYCENFRHRGWSLVFGLSMGLGVLTKWIHLGFLAPFLCWPVLSVLWNASRHRMLGMLAGLAIAIQLCGMAYVATLHAKPMRHDKVWFTFDSYFLAIAVTVLVLLLLRWVPRRHLTDGGRALLNFMESVALAVILLWPWYYYNAPLVLEKVIYQTTVDVPYLDMLQRNILDLSAMVYLGPFLLVLGTAVGLWRKETRVTAAMLMASIVAFVLVIARLPADTRYVLPVLVFLLPLCLLWMPPLGRWAAAPVTLFFLVGLFQAGHFQLQGHVDVSAFEGLTHRQIWTHTSSPVYASWRPLLPEPPDRGSYPYRDVLKAMDYHPTHMTPVAFVAHPDDGAVIQPRSFRYYSLLLGHDIKVVEPMEAVKTGAHSDVHLCDQLVLIYRDPRQRVELLEMVWEYGWFDRTLKSVGTFEFSPDFRVELMKLPPRNPG